tara:strand:- start:647 stop:931 length:285 start_codon:yes stop_codon:yes gene_type:complete
LNPKFGIILDKLLTPPGIRPDIARRAFAGSNRSKLVPEDLLGICELPNAVVVLDTLEKSGKAILKYLLFYVFIGIIIVVVNKGTKFNEKSKLSK